jgi:stearoyl-CoA desaturase (delta-9 desaturase)
MYLLGLGLATWVPSLGVTGLQMLVWGFVISTVVLYHATYTINSLSHLIGSRRFATSDSSRNNFFLAIITLGEGWHNNHHYYPGAVRQGFYWWEIDITYYTLWTLQKLGLVWDLNPVPKRVYERAAAETGAKGGG